MSLILPMVNREKWFANLAKFFVACFCLLFSGHLIWCRKNGNLYRNFRQYYAEESDDYAEKTPDYAEISKIKNIPLAWCT